MSTHQVLPPSIFELAYLTTLTTFPHLSLKKNTPISNPKENEFKTRQGSEEFPNK